MVYLLAFIVLMALVALVIFSAGKIGEAISREQEARHRQNALWEIQDTPLADGTILVQLVRYGERHTRPVGELPPGADADLIHEIRSRAEWERSTLNQPLLMQRKRRKRLGR